MSHKAWYIKNDIQHKTHTVRSESIHAFAFIHHYNGFEIKQPRCDWIADLKLYFKRFHKILHLPFRSYSHFKCSTSIFRGSIVFGQLTKKRLIDQVLSIPSLLSRQIKQIKDLELIRGIKLAFGSCLTGASSMKSSRSRWKWRRPSLSWKKQHNIYKREQKP